MGLNKLKDAVPSALTIDVTSAAFSKDPTALANVLQAFQAAIQEAQELLPQAADKVPRNPRRFMIRYNQLPWDPMGDFTEQWLWYDGLEWALLDN